MVRLVLKLKFSKNSYGISELNKINVISNSLVEFIAVFISGKGFNSLMLAFEVMLDPTKTSFNYNRRQNNE